MISHEAFYEWEARTGLANDIDKEKATGYTRRWWPKFKEDPLLIPRKAQLVMFAVEFGPKLIELGVDIPPHFKALFDLPPPKMPREPKVK